MLSARGRSGGNGSPAAALGRDEKEIAMRSNSGGGKASNNNHNPTLRDAEKEKGVSGMAINKEMMVDATPKRGSTRKKSP